MFRYGVFAVLALIASFVTISNASAKPGRDWELLGKQRVGFLADRDIIKVGRSEGRFEQIMLHVRDNDIEILDLKVIYANGQPDDLPVRQFIRQGGQTRPIDLKGQGRAIREIQVIYRSRPSFKGQALLEVYGKQADKGAGKRDWEELGSRKVGFISDTDVIPVGRREGRFKKIKLRVRDNDIQMQRLVVVYGNGAKDELEVRDFIRAGSETRPIDLKGDGRFIKEVRLKYQARPNFRGHATVQVWGLQD